MKKSMIIAAALLVWATGCSGGGGGGGGQGAKDAHGNALKDSKGNAVSAAAANKFSSGLDAMAQHDKANTWSDATCTSTPPGGTDTQSAPASTCTAVGSPSSTV